MEIVVRKHDPPHHIETSNVCTHTTLILCTPTHNSCVAKITDKQAIQPSVIHRICASINCTSTHHYQLLPSSRCTTWCWSRRQNSIRPSRIPHTVCIVSALHDIDEIIFSVCPLHVRRRRRRSGNTSTSTRSLPR